MHEVAHLIKKKKELFVLFALRFTLLRKNGKKNNYHLKTLKNKGIKLKRE